jgi:hypothetical protein
MQRGFLWACEYGRDAVVEFLLHRGVSLETEAGTGQTALHWSVIGGHVGTIKLLLDRGAQPEAKNGYGATALGQAVWSALHADGGIDYLPIIETLLKAGAQIEAGTVAWITQQKIASPTLKHRIADLLKRHGGEL